jgi:tRNA pseudouridine55 synthase
MRSGVFLLDKPSGLSSNGALQRVRRLLGRVKAGHTGTLDPMATGLLPLCLGEATKFASGLLEADKTYEAVVRLGTATSTGDAEGEAVFHGDITGVAERLDEALCEFRGDIDQTPPMFSALKYRGRPLYEYARQGQDIERIARRVRVYELSVLNRDGADIALKVRCSKGTYVRSLAHDLGLRLGCGAHLIALRRTVIGSLRIGEATSLAALEALEEPVRWSRVLRSDVLLSHLEKVVLPTVDGRAILQGKVVETPAGFEGRGMVRVYDENGIFLGLGEAQMDRRLVAKRMCSDRATPGTQPSLEEVPVSS